MPMDEKKRAAIKREAKQILDKFSKALASVKASDSNVERDSDRREEGKGVDCDSDFREIMFDNAPKRNKDFIIAEKKQW